MKLIQSLSTVLGQGVQVKLMLQANGDQIQLDILPTGKENKAGISLPPKSLIGTAAELDAELETFMEVYGQSVAKISSIIAASDADLQAAEKEAQDQASRALAEKRAKSAAQSPSKPGTKPGSKPARDMDAGLTGPNEGGGGDDTPTGGESVVGGDGTSSGASEAPSATDGDTKPALPDLFTI